MLPVVFVIVHKNPWGNEEGPSQTGCDNASKQNEPFIPAAARLKSSGFSFWCLSFPFHRVTRPLLGHCPHVRDCNSFLLPAPNRSAPHPLLCWPAVHTHSEVSSNLRNISF